MKYVWASWRNSASELAAGERVKGPTTRHIKGYGRAVSFSSSDEMAWSSPQATYSLHSKAFQASIVKI